MRTTCSSLKPLHFEYLNEIFIRSPFIPARQHEDDKNMKKTNSDDTKIMKIFMNIIRDI